MKISVIENEIELYNRKNKTSFKLFISTSTTPATSLEQLEINMFVITKENIDEGSIAVNSLCKWPAFNLDLTDSESSLMEKLNKQYGNDISKNLAISLNNFNEIVATKTKS